MAQAQAAADSTRADGLLLQVEALKAKALGLLEAAEKAGDLRTALTGIKEARGCLELLAKLLGELDESPKVQIALSAEWVELRQTIFLALEPYPEARAHLAEVLVEGR
jgi:hypothetical protein